MRRTMSRLLPFALAASLAVPLVACSGTTPTAGGAETGATETQPAVLAGMPVYVNRGGQWYAATVVRQTSAASVLIHYEGAPPEYDEDVPFDRVRSRPDATPAPAPYQVGDVVLVNAQNRVYLAEIRQLLDGGQIRVRFTAFGPEAVDNVTPDRVQRPFAGATAFPLGSEVQVTTGPGQAYPGKVIAVIREDQWLVRLDGFGPEYDQIAGPDKVQARGAAAPAASSAAAPAASASAPAATPAAPAATSAAPAAPPPAAAPQETFKTGDVVLVLVRSLYYPGKVVAAGAGQGPLRVRLDGQSADEEVARKQVVRLPDPLKGVKYRAGQEVYMEWHGVYAPAKIVKEADAGNYKVRVEGADATADDLVPVRRLRPRK